MGGARVPPRGVAAIAGARENPRPLAAAAGPVGVLVQVQADGGRDGHNGIGPVVPLLLAVEPRPAATPVCVVRDVRVEGPEATTGLVEATTRGEGLTQMGGARIPPGAAAVGVVVAMESEESERGRATPGPVIARTRRPALQPAAPLDSRALLRGRRRVRAKTTGGVALSVRPHLSEAAARPGLPKPALAAFAAEVTPRHLQVTPRAAPEREGVIPVPVHPPRAILDGEPSMVRRLWPPAPFSGAAKGAFPGPPDDWTHPY